MTSQARLPIIDGITPTEVEAKLAAAAVACPTGSHRDHGDRVYILVEAHIADVAHPEIVEDGLRVGVTRLEKAKSDGAWLIDPISGAALAKLARRRHQLDVNGGQREILPDTDLRDDVRDGLAHLLELVDVMFTGAPDDLSDLD